AMSIAGSDIQYYSRLETTRPISAFPRANTPPWSHTDRATDIDQASGYTLSGVRVIPEAGILTLEAKPYPADTLLTDWSTTHSTSGIAWMQQIDAKTGKNAIVLPDSTANATFTATTLGNLGADRSFYLRLG